MPYVAPIRLSFVCLGNICRSPTAAAVMHHVVAEADLSDAITIDSAGTGAWHIGDGADPRAVIEARSRGIAMPHRARQFVASDFARFDMVLAMDHQNQRDLLALADADGDRGKVRLLREYDAAAVAAGDLQVPDPYFGGPDGFAEAFDMVERACRGLLAHIQAGSSPHP
jgi:protein-tyrosine phosphatase